jgi:peptide/nickel transport system substrate-binding protein
MGWRSQRSIVVPLALLVFAAGCASPGGPAAGASDARQEAGGAVGPKRLSLVVPNEPAVLYYPLAPVSTRGGASLLFEFLHPGVALSDNEGLLRPVLVEAVPSLDNGLWTVTPDGRMLTTWRLRGGATWHDGVPLTSEDLAFTLQLLGDRDLPALRNRNHDLIEQVATPDSQTLTIAWKRPFIDADRAFTYPGSVAFAPAVPKHILDPVYAANKPGLLDHRYWSDEFVGLGPYRLEQWERGSRMTLLAFDRYALGRPKIDEVEVRFIPDQNTIISNFLAGTADVFSGAALGVDQGLQLRDQWREGRVNPKLTNWVALFAQFMDPQPPVVLNPQLRKALLHAIDRQAMADTLMAGLVPVAPSVLDPNSREFKATERDHVAYPLDPRRAAQMIEGLGYLRGGDGLFRDALGQPLTLQLRGAASRDIHVKGLFPIADNWQQVGVTPDILVVSAQGAQDAQDEATFRAFRLVRQNNHLDRLISFHSSQARTAERNYTGTNGGRYMNPEMDALIDRYLVTVPWDERMEVIGRMVHHFTDQLPAMPLFYDLEFAVVSHRVQNASALLLPGTSQMWDAHEWEIR